MSSADQVVKNISYNWVGMAVGLVIGFVQAPIVVKGLGNTWFGIWVLVNQLVSYAWLFDLGIREAIVRHVSKHHARKEYQEINEIVSSGIYLYLAVSFLTIAAVSGGTLLLPHLFKLEPEVVGTARLVLFLSGVNIAINWFFNAYIGILMGLQRFDIFQKIGIGMGLVGFTLIISFIKAGYGVIALSLISLGGSMVGNGLIYWNCRRLLPEFKLIRFDRGKIRFGTLINYGKYVLLNNISAKIIFNIDAVIIGFFLQAAAITFYAIPGTLVNMLRNLVSSATWVMNPLFSEMESKYEMERLKSIFGKATKLSVLAGLPVGIVYLFMGNIFISLWMGEGYGERSGRVLAILTLGVLFTSWENIIGSLLYGVTRHQIIAWLRSAEAVGKVVLCLLLIKPWGIVGVALGNALTHILFMGIILPFVVCRNLNLPLGGYVWDSILSPVVASIPFAFCCYLLAEYYPARNLIIFFSSIAAIMPVFTAGAWFIAFNKAERNEYSQRILGYAPWLRGFSRTTIR